MIHCYFKPQPRKDDWVMVPTGEDGPQNNTWTTPQEVRAYFKSTGYPVEMREDAK